MAYTIDGTGEDCYPDTNVLINKLDIRTESALREAESQITTYASLTVEQTVKFENVDFDFYKNLHRTLFEPLYDWAGKVRTINISKMGTPFCDHTDIEDSGRRKFAYLRKLNFLSGMDGERFLDELTELYSDLNMIHPFREGNGRTLRLFITLLVRNTGRDISFSATDEDSLMLATVRAAQGDTSPLRRIFESIITE